MEQRAVGVPRRYGEPFWIREGYSAWPLPPESCKIIKNVGTATMIIGITFALVTLGIAIYEIQEKIQHYQFLKKCYPEYMRDRNKPLQVGQVWIHVITTRTITDVSGNRITYEYHIPPNPLSRYDGSTTSVTRTAKEFRKEIKRYRLNLQNVETLEQPEPEVMYERAEAAR
jgi:hypothetical protein